MKELKNQHYDYEHIKYLSYLFQLKMENVTGFAEKLNMNIIAGGEESESEGLCIPDLPGYSLFAG